MTKWKTEKHPYLGDVLLEDLLKELLHRTKNKDSCLSCRYEPEWGEPIGDTFVRRYGDCRWFKTHDMPILPQVVGLNWQPIARHEDDSGVMTECKTWEPKV